MIEEQLTDAEVEFLWSTRFGGGATGAQLDAFVPGAGPQLAFVVLDAASEPVGVISISVAQDGGSASKSGNKMRDFVRACPLPVHCVVAGLGWADRNETAELARDLGGRLYSERSIENLIAALRT